MHGIAYYTTVTGANAAAEAILSLLHQELRVTALQDYLS